jgi:hypothetical protein
VTFADLARIAIEKHVPEARDPSAHWATGRTRRGFATGAVWCYYAYFGCETICNGSPVPPAISRTPRELNDLLPLPAHVTRVAPGYRFSLGDLLNSGDRWWPAGRTREEQIECLDSLALQMSVHGRTTYLDSGPVYKA